MLSDIRKKVETHRDRAYMLRLNRKRRGHRVRARSRRNHSKRTNRKGAKVMRWSRRRDLSEEALIRTDTFMLQIKTYRSSSSRSSRTSETPIRCRERRECCKLSSQLCRQMVVLLGI